ncbi:hypothetical protein CATMIT_01829, partial [Catenibacterium mitsuokai DSM 15897]
AHQLDEGAGGQVGGLDHQRVTDARRFLAHLLPFAGHGELRVGQERAFDRLAHQVLAPLHHHVVGERLRQVQRLRYFGHGADVVVADRHHAVELQHLVLGAQELDQRGHVVGIEAQHILGVLDHRMDLARTRILVVAAVAGDEGVAVPEPGDRRRENPAGAADPAFDHQQ